MDSPAFLQQKLPKQRASSGRINRNRREFVMAQMLWQLCPDANTYIMSKAAQLLRTHTTFSLGFHLCCQLQSGPQATFPKHPPNFRMWMLKLWSCRTLHPPLRTIHVHEIYMMILAPLPKNGRPCSETWHRSTEDVPWVLPPKFITQWSYICKVEYEVRILMGWYDLTCTSSCLIKKVRFY